MLAFLLAVVTLAWDPVPEADSYRVYQNGVLVLDTTETQATIGNLWPGVPVLFWVSSRRGALESSPSDSLPYTPPLEVSIKQGEITCLAWSGGPPVKLLCADAPGGPWRVLGEMTEVFTGVFQYWDAPDQAARFYRCAQ